jgi:hypothetical protein
MVALGCYGCCGRDAGTSRAVVAPTHSVGFLGAFFWHSLCAGSSSVCSFILRLANEGEGIIIIVIAISEKTCCLFVWVACGGDDDERSRVVFGEKQQQPQAAANALTDRCCEQTSPARAHSSPVPLLVIRQCRRRQAQTHADTPGRLSPLCAAAR